MICPASLALPGPPALKGVLVENLLPLNLLFIFINIYLLADFHVRPITNAQFTAKGKTMNKDSLDLDRPLKFGGNQH